MPDATPTRESTHFWILTQLEELHRRHFWGTVTYTFQDGKLVLRTTNQTEKPPA